MTAVALVDWENLLRTVRRHGFCPGSPVELAEALGSAIDQVCRSVPRSTEPPSTIKLFETRGITQQPVRASIEALGRFQFLLVDSGKNMADMRLGIEALELSCDHPEVDLVIVSDDADVGLVSKHIGGKLEGGRRVLHLCYRDRAPGPAQNAGRVTNRSIGRILRRQLTHRLDPPVDEAWTDAALHLSFLGLTLPFTLDGESGSQPRPEWSHVPDEAMRRIVALDSLVGRIGWKAAWIGRPIGAAMADSIHCVGERHGFDGPNAGADALAALARAGLLLFTRGSVTCETGWHDGLLAPIRRMVLWTTGSGDRRVLQRRLYDAVRTHIVTNLPDTRAQRGANEEIDRWRKAVWGRAITATTRPCLRVFAKEGKGDETVLRLLDDHPFVVGAQTMARRALTAPWAGGLSREQALRTMTAQGIRDGGQFLATLAAARLLREKDGRYVRTSSHA